MAYLHATYLVNMFGRPRLEGRSPHYEFYREAPNVSHLRVWGAPAFKHLDKDNRTHDSLCNASTLGYYVGHAPEHKNGLLVCVPQTNTILTPSRDVLVNERAIFTEGDKTPMPKPVEFHIETGWERNRRDPADLHCDPDATACDPGGDSDEGSSSSDEESLPKPTRMGTRANPTPNDAPTYVPAQVKDLRSRGNDGPKSIHNAMTLTTILTVMLLAEKQLAVNELFYSHTPELARNLKTPGSTKEALHSGQPSEREKWKRARHEEFKNLDSNHTWIPCILPNDRKAIGAKTAHLRCVPVGVSANVWPNFQNLGQMLPQPTSVAPTVTTKRPPRQCAQRSKPTWSDQKNTMLYLNQILKFNNIKYSCSVMRVPIRQRW